MLSALSKVRSSSLLQRGKLSFLPTVRFSTTATDSQPKEFESVVFYGRTMKEYEIMFDMKVADISKGSKILDCPGGPSSFQRQGRDNFGLSVVSIDPMYATPDDELAAIGKRDILATSAKIRANPDVYPDIGANLEDVEKNRIRALDRFMDDFRARKGTSYISAYLPTLPFSDKQFDLTFSGHLLFCYSHMEDGGLMKSRMFDLKWHREAINELLRVTTKEIVVYPIHAYTPIHPEKPGHRSPQGVEIHPYAKVIIDELTASGVADCSLYAPNYFGTGIDLGLKIVKK